MKNRWFILLAWLSTQWLPSDSGAAPIPQARLAPPPGIAIAPAERMALERATMELAGEIAALETLLHDKPALRDLLPDVQIYHKAVHWALTYDEFFRTNEFGIARALLTQGLKRAKQLREGKAPWLTATGLVVRGYVSKIDGSVQPYGLVVPPTWTPGNAGKHRLDVWLHGRDNHLTELKFISERQRSFGEFVPTDTFVLHSYGRYCNAFKFAGEVDVFEALEHAQKSYPIDEHRLTVRGFSMGGAGCWHLAAHHAGTWAAAAPGAGFAETAQYTRILEREPQPAWYQQKLWHLYDASDYAANLFNCPTIAYSGELDKQKQAADVMAKMMKQEGLNLVHLIGPKVEHKYEPETKTELARRIHELAAKGREPVPRKIHLTTWTLRYNQVAWLVVEGLEKHWERARVEAEIIDERTLGFKTENVTAIAVRMPAGECPLDRSGKIAVRLDGQTLTATPLATSLFSASFEKERGRWKAVEDLHYVRPNLRKHPGLQGPIDDAFMNSFLVVRPTGKPLNEAIGAWVAAELAHATNEWRAQFRGDARVKDDVNVTDADIAAHNLVLWGDPFSNRLLARIERNLPLRWNKNEVRLGANLYAAERHLPVLIFPNPLNAQRYVVLNSGFTFCEFGQASNALQTPKLPDVAMLDITVPHAARLRDGVVWAGFFNERWELPQE